VAESAAITALRTQIAEAKAAYHKLVMGDKEVQVGFGTQRFTQWSPAKVPELKAYIADLEAQLSVMLGGLRRGPIYPMGIPR
jgi:hypothetical protein